MTGSPCGVCGWAYSTYHICIPPEAPVVRSQKAISKDRSLDRHKNRVYETRRYTPEWRQKVSEGLIKAQAKTGPRTAERNALIIEDYHRHKMTAKELAEKYDLNHRSILRILHQAADLGVVEDRPEYRRANMKKR